MCELIYFIRGIQYQFDSELHTIAVFYPCDYDAHAHLHKLPRTKVTRSLSFSVIINIFYKVRRSLRQMVAQATTSSSCVDMCECVMR